MTFRFARRRSIGLAPEAHGIRITGPSFGGFAENDLTHEDRTGRAPAWLGEGLRRALFNYMEGRGLTVDVRRWFDRPVPRPKAPRDWVDRALAEGSREEDDPTAERRFVWVGGEPVIERHHRTRSRLILPNRVEDAEVRLSPGKAEWLATLIRTATPARTKRGEGYPLLRDVRARFPFGGPRAFDAMPHSVAWQKARTVGLLLV